MITVIFGKPGAGKSAYATYLMKTLYEEHKNEIWKYSCREIEKLNREYGRNFSLPTQAPIFANFDVSLHLGYKWYFEPYFFSPYYFGLANEKMETQYLPPGSKVFIDEAQRFFNSRKSMTFPDWLSEAIEKHRHFGLDLYLIVQRPMLIDPNCRELVGRFVEIKTMKNVTNYAGVVDRSTFYCKEFDDWLAVKQYLEGAEADYKDTQYEHEGDIFESFDSFSFTNSFLPKDAGMDFDYLPSRQRVNKSKLSARQRVFYQTSEPKEFRGR